MGNHDGRTAGMGWLIAGLCVLVPLGAILAVSVFGIPVSTLFLVGMLALCPLMHVFMMRGHGSGHGHEPGHGHGTGELGPGHVHEADEHDTSHDHHQHEERPKAEIPEPQHL